MKNPLISVIIPTHSSVNTVEMAVRSILDQTYKNLEVIVVGDNVVGNIEEIVKNMSRNDSRVKYFTLPGNDPNRYSKKGRNVNAGYMARNYGVEKAKGEWITFQDADDVSLLNRVEAEYILAKRYGANHICVEWQQLTPGRIGTSFDFERALKENSGLITESNKIILLAKKSRGLLMRLLGPLRKYVSLEVKTMRIINKLFFGSLDSYPGSGNSPLFKKEVFHKVRFRPSDERVWPSFTGRGADRDFNFQVALTFKKSMSFKLPLYLWRVNRENELGYDFNKYLIK